MQRKIGQVTKTELQGIGSNTTTRTKKKQKQQQQLKKDVNNPNCKTNRYLR
jgi:hypothetical protein